MRRLVGEADSARELARRMLRHLPDERKVESAVKDLDRLQEGRSVQLDKIVALCRAAGVSADWLLGLSDAPLAAGAAGWDEEEMRAAIREYILRAGGEVGVRAYWDAEDRIIELYLAAMARRVAAQPAVDTK